MSQVGLRFAPLSVREYNDQADLWDSLAAGRLDAVYAGSVDAAGWLADDAASDCLVGAALPVPDLERFAPQPANGAGRERGTGTSKRRRRLAVPQQAGMGVLAGRALVRSGPVVWL